MLQQINTEMVYVEDSIHIAYEHRLQMISKIVR